MARDYANKSKKSKNATRGNSSKKRNRVTQRQSSSTNSLILGVVIGGLIVAAFFVKEHHIEQLKKTVLASLQTNQTVKPHAINKPNEPEFDFYTILPKQKVWAPKTTDDNANTNNNSISTNTTSPEESNQISAVTKNQSSTAENKTNVINTPKTVAAAPIVTPKQNLQPRGYIVQLGAFEQYATADELKAKFTLEGYAVNVDPKPVNGWTRVWIGPFKTLTEAQKIQSQIAQNDHMRGIIQSNED